MSADPRTSSERATRCASILGVGETKINRGDYRTSVVALVSCEKWLRDRRDSGIVVGGKNLFPKQKENRMVNLTQVLKHLRVERSRAQKEVDGLEKAIDALQKLGGNPGRQPQGNEPRKKRKLSAAARRRISRAQKARWAKIRR